MEEVDVLKFWVNDDFNVFGLFFWKKFLNIVENLLFDRL